MKRVFIKTVLAAVTLAAMGVASAQDKTIKFANQNAVGHPIVQGMEKFKEIVEKQSGGKIKVNVFPGGLRCSISLSCLPAAKKLMWW
jgi:TRAP-type C4-dicarboxylate transport system substrate-binding protein